MATVVPAPQGQTGWGMDILRTIIALQDRKTQTKIAERELALKKVYYNLLGSEAKRKQALAPMLESEARAKAKSAELAAAEDQRLADVYAANPDLLEQKMLADVEYSQTRGASKAAEEERRLMQTMISALNTTLSSERAQRGQEKDDVSRAMNLFFNPTWTRTIKAGLGEEAFKEEQDKAASKILGFPVKSIKLKTSVYGAAKEKLGLGETSDARLTLDRSITKWREGAIEGEELWKVWKDELSFRGWEFFQGQVKEFKPPPRSGKQAPAPVDISSTDALQKLLKDIEEKRKQ